MNPALLDTDIVSYYLRGDGHVRSYVARYLAEYPALNFSIFTYYEILSGLRYRDAHQYLATFQQFVTLNRMLPLTSQSVDITAELYATLRSQGNLIEDIDLLIASIALEHEYELITNTTAHFHRIPKLTVTSWAESISWGVPNLSLQRTP